MSCVPVFKRKASRWPALLLAVLLFCPLTGAKAADVRDLLSMDVEELMQLQVVSAMRKPQSVSDTASAIYVITREDIRRSGATALPEMLRMVPGVEVARVNGHKWAVTARGFNGEFADKLLVMIDGRSVYTPLHGGVYWDVQDFVAEDVERIEVIRGPGGSLWGANAINGIINVITRSSRDTHGGLIVGGAGNKAEDRGFATLRYGGRLSEHGDYRAYIKGFQRQNGAQFFTDPQIAQWRHLQGGFRTDWQPSGRDELTVQGDLYRAEEGLKTSLTALTAPYNQTIADTVKNSGGNITTHWKREISSTSWLDLHLYYDRTRRDKTSFTELRNTYDIDMQHRFSLGSMHELVWGLGYRLSRDETRGSYFSSLTPASGDMWTASAVLQDEIHLADDRLRLTFGSKFEYNNYTRYEAQPSVRALWRGEGYSMWASAGRAVRVPSRGERNLVHHVAVIPPIPPFMPNPTPITVLNNPNFGPMYVHAYEAGIRGQVTKGMSVDVAAFYNTYKGLGVSVQQGFDYLLTNDSDGRTYGVETVLRWQPTNFWRLESTFSWLRSNLHATAPNVSFFDSAGNSPSCQFKLHSAWSLPGGVELDAFLYRLSAIASANTPPYGRVDLRLGWKPQRDVELALVGQNLFDKYHVENSNYRVPRSAYGKITWYYR